MSPKFRVILTGSAAALLLGLCLLPGTAAAQSQGQGDDSVANAARRAREQKKNAKPVRTLTNDDLPAAPVAAVEGKPASASSDDADADLADKASGTAVQKTEKGAAAADDAAKEKRAARKAELETALKQVKANLAESEGELNVLQRKEALDSDSYYSKTDYRDDTAGKATLEQDAQDISDKKTRIESIKSRIANLTAELAEFSDGEPAQGQAPEQKQDQEQPPSQPQQPPAQQQPPQ